MARTMGRKDTFGAFLDSTLDRIADGAIFAGLALYFAWVPRTGSTSASPGVPGDGLGDVLRPQPRRGPRLRRQDRHRRARRPPRRDPGADLLRRRPGPADPLRSHPVAARHRQHGDRRSSGSARTPSGARPRRLRQIPGRPPRGPTNRGMAETPATPTAHRHLARQARDGRDAQGRRHHGRRHRRAGEDRRGRRRRRRDGPRAGPRRHPRAGRREPHERPGHDRLASSRPSRSR